MPCATWSNDASISSKTPESWRPDITKPPIATSALSTSSQFLFGVDVEEPEVACHSARHVPLDQLGLAEFRTDLRRNLASLRDAGASDVIGYRALSFSLIALTDWACKIMAEEGITYSSSALSARNPLYGWLGFGRARKVIDGVLALPMTVLASRAVQPPAAGGVFSEPSRGLS